MSIQVDLVPEFYETLVDWPELPEEGMTAEDYSQKYDRIIARLKELAVNLGSYMWEIGDVLTEAEVDHSNFPSAKDIPSYMLIGCHPPNFWKTISDQVGLSVASLKLYANVARAFPKEKRRAELTWSHHLTAHIYVDRDVYLQACIVRGIEESGKPHTIRWLEEYIEEQETCVQHAREERRALTVDLPLDMVRKFSDLARHYYHKPVKEIVTGAARPALEAYLIQKAEQISLEFFAYSDGKTWPFGVDAKRKLGGHWPTFAERMRARKIA